MKETQAASWHRERKAKRESVCVKREINNFVSISYLMLFVDDVVFFVLFPKEDEKIYSFTDTCSKH